MIGVPELVRPFCHQAENPNAEAFQPAPLEYAGEIFSVKSASCLLVASKNARTASD